MKRIALVLIIIIFFLLQPVLTLAGNEDTFTISATLGTTYPKWFNPEEDPWSPVVWYPSECYDFTVIWSGLTEISEVWMEFDSYNYSVTERTIIEDPEGYKYYFTICDLAKGNHTYKWYAKNIGGNWNSTGSEAHYIYELVSPCDDDDLTCESLYQSGIGAGSFLIGINTPLFNFLLFTGVIFSVIAIFYGVSTFIVPKFKQD